MSSHSAEAVVAVLMTRRDNIENADMIETGETVFQPREILRAPRQNKTD